MTEFKPKKPFLYLSFAIGALIGAFFMFTSPYLNIKMSLLAGFFLMASIAFLYLVDMVYATIEFTKNELKISGYFSFRKTLLNLSEIKGYKLCEQINQTDGLHDEIRIVTSLEKEIKIFKAAYSDYLQVQEYLRTNFEYLGYEPLKYKNIGKWMPLVYAISGLLALLVALKKIF